MPLSSAQAVARIAAWAEAGGLRLAGDSRAGAVFSRCGSYRYLLWRDGGARAGFVAMAMLNPSTADHLRDDRTIARCRGFAAAEGRPLLVCNLFALRATDPVVLKAHAGPEGPDNDAAILLAFDLAHRIIAAWGNHGAHRGRDGAVLDLARSAGRPLHALRLTGAGHPSHPLYLPATARPFRWK